MGLLICTRRIQRPFEKPYGPNARNRVKRDFRQRALIETADGATHNHTVNPFLMNHDDCSYQCGLLNNNNFEWNLFVQSPMNDSDKSIVYRFYFDFDHYLSQLITK